MANKTKNKKSNVTKMAPITGQTSVYHMSYLMFKEINKTRDKDEKRSPKRYVLSVLNNEFGIKGKITDIVLHSRL